MNNLGVAEAAAIEAGASRSKSKPRGQPVAELLNTGCVTSLPERLAIAIRLGRLLQSAHRKGRSYGNLDIHAVRLADDDQVTISYEPVPGKDGIRNDIHAFGHIINQLLIGAASSDHDVDSLGCAGFAAPLVRTVDDCINDPTRPGVLPRTISELERQLRCALGVNSAKRFTLSLYLKAAAVATLASAGWIFWNR